MPVTYRLTGGWQRMMRLSRRRKTTTDCDAGQERHDQEEHEAFAGRQDMAADMLDIIPLAARLFGARMRFARRPVLAAEKIAICHGFSAPFSAPAEVLFSITLHHVCF
ncbi:hypothetical protein DTW90_11870 [Neorhizobium sp. P12A]|nr:hypothetical protein DTW90_11870 [Neorhizobium sp. P12A]